MAGPTDEHESAAFWYQRGLDQPSALDSPLSMCERDLMSKYPHDSVRWNDPSVGCSWLSVLSLIPRPHPDKYYEERIERFIKTLVLHKLREG